MLNPLKGFSLWRTIATLFLGIIIGMYVYHTFFDAEGDSVEIGKFKIKSNTEVEGNKNKTQEKQEGFIKDLFDKD